MLRRLGRIRIQTALLALSAVACVAGPGEEDPLVFDPGSGSGGQPVGVWGGGGDATYGAGGQMVGGCPSVQYRCDYYQGGQYWSYSLAGCIGVYETFIVNCDGSIESNGGGVVLSGDAGLGGESSTGGASSGGASATGGAGSGAIPGADRCGFEYSSCIALAIDGCVSLSNDAEDQSVCAGLVDDCRSDHERCVLDAPACENQVSSCFSTAEACLVAMPDSVICDAHYSFCLDLAVECQLR